MLTLASLLLSLAQQLPVTPTLWVDFNPGSLGSAPNQLLTVGDQVFFGAKVGSPNLHNLLHRYEPNQTPTPQLVTHAGAVLELPFNNLFTLVPYLDGIAFTARKDLSGTVWSVYWTNGTTTIRLSDRDLLSPASFLTVVGERLYFFAQPEGAPGAPELMYSAGQPADTVFVDLIPGPGGYIPTDAAAVGNRLVFDGSSILGRELVSTDGTLEGTQVIDLIAGGVSSDPTQFVTLGQLAYFFAYNPLGSAQALWRTDGTGPGTQVVLELPSGSSGAHLTAFNQKLLWHEQSLVSVTTKISTGTLAGTQTLSADATGKGGEFIPADNVVYYTTEQQFPNRRLWKSDGTAIGTQLVTALESAGASISFLAFKAAHLGGGILALCAGPGNDAELWRTDGTAQGTYQLTDSNPGPLGGAPGFSQVLNAPVAMARVEAYLLFAATTASEGSELHRLPVGLTGAAIATSMGSGCGSAKAALSVNSSPLLGQTLDLRLNQVAPLAVGAMFVDVDLNLLGVPGACTILLPNPTLLTSLTTDASGDAQLLLPIPVAPQWIGLPFYLQALVVAPGEPLLGLAALSNGLEVICAQ
jgi:ELWxxDGT repeat protein